MMAQV